MKSQLKRSLYHDMDEFPATMAVNVDVAAEQERCSRRATRMIVQPLTKMENRSLVQTVSVSLARG